MKSRYLKCVAQVGLFVLAANIGALAQNWTSDRLPERFSGQINAYTPTTTKAPTGPYEIRGSWSLKLKERRDEGGFFRCREHDPVRWLGLDELHCTAQF